MAAATWSGTARSNYFKVKDATAFLSWCSKMNFQVRAKKDTKGEDTYSICPSDFSDVSAWPAGYFDPKVAAHVIHDLVPALAALLAPGEVVVLVESGAARLDYVTGYAIAFNDQGTFIDISLEDIYTQAKTKFGKAPGRAEY